MIAHLVVGIACLTLAVAVPIATVAILAGDGALHRQATRGCRAVARWVRGPFQQPEPPASGAPPAVRHPAGKRVPGLPVDGAPLTEAELEAFAVLMFAAKVPQGQEPAYGGSEGDR